MIQSFKVDRYELVYGSRLDSLPFNNIFVHSYCTLICYGGGMQLYVYFLTPESADGKPGTELSKNRGSMTMPMSSLDGILNLLEDARDTYGVIRDDNPNWNVLTTNPNL
ncbi:MAG: hypothetical protein AAFN10_22795 [Bacteroidota bacterium]